MKMPLQNEVLDPVWMAYWLGVYAGRGFDRVVILRRFGRFEIVEAAPEWTEHEHVATVNPQRLSVADIDIIGSQWLCRQPTGFNIISTLKDTP